MYHQPFVGRAAELTVLAKAHDHAASGHARLVLVEGPAGIGKTTLVSEFLRAAKPGTLVALSAAEAEAALPWGVLSQLRGLPADWYSPLTDDPLTVGKRLADILGAPAAAGVTALVIEDLQWIDECSAAALRVALRRLPARPLLVILTLRPAEMLEAYEDWRRLADDRGGPRIRLDGLAPAELGELAAGYGTGPLTVPAAGRLWRHTRGNPLYARALIEELEPEILTAPAGPLPAPTVLTAQVAARLAACAAPARDLVRAVAVLGERCPLIMASALAAVESPDVALSKGVAVGLLTETHDGGARHVEFAHPLMRTAVYAMLAPVRRAKLHVLAARLHTGAVALSHLAAAKPALGSAGLGE